MKPSRSVVRATLRVLPAVAVLVLLTGCLRFDLRYLASDGLHGRNNNSAGGLAARAYVLDRLKEHTVGPVPGQTGDAAYLQPFTQGANVIGVIPGSVRPDEYVLIGGHYDHLGSCGTVNGDTICNGATDNGAGAALVLEMADRFAAHPPERSVAFVLWDAEEDGLLGSRWYVDHPVIPLDRTVAYLNLDIQGANLLPSLRHETFAVGASSGGPALSGVVDAAYAPSFLHGNQLSAVFGLYRSDYAPFLGKSVPTVFFTDSTGPCYHTPEDDESVVDWTKLDEQANVLWRTAGRLAFSDSQVFVTPAWTVQPTATYTDAVRLKAVVDLAEADFGRFPQALLDELAPHRAALDQIVADGPAQFDDADQGTLLNAAAVAVELLTYGDCDGFVD